MSMDGLIVIPIMAWLVVLIVRRMGKHPKARETLEMGLVVLRLGTFQLTDSMLLVYGCLFGVAGTTALLTFGAIRRYETISHLCEMIWNSS